VILVNGALVAYLARGDRLLLTWLPETELVDHVELKVRGVDGERVTLKHLRTELSVIRQQGFATDDAQASIGIQCVAAPVFDLSGLTGAIGVSFLRGSVDSIESTASLVRAATARTSQVLGGGHHR